VEKGQVKPAIVSFLLSNSLIKIPD